MKINTNPDDPEFRKALRELGAPDWYPQDAPRHTVTGNYDNDIVVFVCPICGWEKHITTGEQRTLTTINKGNEWALHSGSTAPEIFKITGIWKTDDPFEKWANEYFGCDA